MELFRKYVTLWGGGGVGVRLTKSHILIHGGGVLDGPSCDGEANVKNNVGKN